ncbi:ABC transporter, permease [Moorella glycerini]|uniref:Ribose transport system permease protein RbsC n=1 Tax=Neomoorella stamsii TaxID=1266720 RepID=A0A9X7J5X4_9FIRM|nr:MULTISPECIES: ribose ABC transporter permease [Moorella]PRR77451.1 Ribose transport system permease protein RbsC [Moorella stamsii]CEP68200.1 ABC transporter, permease [Moorella glycerini]
MSKAIEQARTNTNINFKALINFFAKYYLVFTLLVLIITGSVLSDKFLMTRNIVNVLLQNSIMTIISMGMLFTIITGGIDLSVGSIVALSGCLVAGFIQGGMSIFQATFISLLLMSLIGLCSGILVSYGKIAPFIVTLAMMTIVRGMAYIYQVGADRRIDGTALPEIINSNVGIVPVPVIVMAIIVVIAGFILEKTTFGRGVYAIGGNVETARLAGINVNLHLILVYIISAVLAALSGIILAGRLSMGTALVGQGFELDAIAAVVVGGASLSGGTGTVVNTLMGAFIIGILANIMNLLGIAAYPQMIIKGIIIIAAVLIRKE